LPPAITGRVALGEPRRPDGPERRPVDR